MDMGYAGPLRKVDTPITTGDVEDKLGDKPGRLVESALTHFGGLLYLARSSRPDLAYAVGFLTRYAANWSEAFDVRLKRVFEYLESTVDHGITWTLMRPDAGYMSMKVFCDADHGGCADTARSTTGWNAFFVGSAGPWPSWIGRPAGKPLQPRAPKRPRWLQAPSAWAGPCRLPRRRPTFPATRSHSSCTPTRTPPA